MVQAARMIKAAERLEMWSDSKLNAAAARALLEQSATSDEDTASRLARARNKIIADVSSLDDDKADHSRT